MKKIISLFIFLATFVIGCIPTAMASFVVNENEGISSNQHWIQLSNNDCCDNMSSDCNENTHDCCISPFEDTNVTWNIVSQNEAKKIKFKSFWLDYLALINESSELNYIEKLTSPPEFLDIKKQNNLYISLIWIVKSNC